MIGIFSMQKLAIPVLTQKERGKENQFFGPHMPGLMLQDSLKDLLMNLLKG